MKRFLVFLLCVSAACIPLACGNSNNPYSPAPLPTPTITSTPTITFTPTITRTPTNIPTPTPSFTPTNSPTITQTFTPSNTATNSPTPTESSTATKSPTITQTFTPTNTATNSPTPTITSTPAVQGIISVTAGLAYYYISGGVTQSSVKGITITAGNDVVWDASNNPALTHPLHLNDTNGVGCLTTGPASFPATFTFNTPGTYAYHCGNHGSCGIQNATCPLAAASCAQMVGFIVAQ